MVYQFSLPPLLAEALLSQDGAALTRWLSQLEVSRPGTTFFNFTASHDGVGVRPLEGILSRQQRAALVRAARERGALVSTKRDPDGTDSPYELNVTYLDLLWDPDPRQHRARFLASQAIMLSLRGIPGIYFHSLVGTLNDTRAASTSGIARRINRRKFRRDQLEADLSRSDSRQRTIWDAYRHLLQVRRVQRAFHPEGGQQVYCLSDAAVLAYLRTAPDQQQHILVVANLSGRCRTVDLARTGLVLPTWDLLSAVRVESDPVTLAPYQVMWLSNSQSSEQAVGIRRNET
jgi:sucrose phosphorylase